MIELICKLFNKQQKPRRNPKSTIDSKISISGRCYDLNELYTAINNRYFNGKIDVDIRWAGNSRSIPRRHITLGSYHHGKKLIKIHRLLDQPNVPLNFISYVIYHEILHHVLPPIKHKAGRRKIHHPAFLAKEKEFHAYEEAQAFEKRLKKFWFNKRAVLSLEG